jgi:two-component system response regulator MprA
MISSTFDALSKRRARILVVDDNDYGQLDSMRKVLTQEGYTVEAAIDVKSALEKHEVFQPHLILLDVHLGPNAEFGGLEILETIRDYDDKTVMIVITGKYKEPEIRAWVEKTVFKKGKKGVIDFVTDDIPTSALLARLEKRLQEGWPGLASTIFIGNEVKIETETRQLSVHERDDSWATRHLEPQEFNVLMELVSKACWTVSLEELWNLFEASDDSNPGALLRSCVSHLRHKLKPYDVFIETIHKVGYRFNYDCRET